MPNPVNFGAVVMKAKPIADFAVMAAVPVFLLTAAPVRAATTIDPVNKHSYAANLGWIDWRGDTNNGAVIGEYVCSGYVWAANVGWIDLGDGSPANGIQYQNNSSTDYGVNHDGLGHLRGLAYGANIGWILFTNATASGALPAEDVPQLDLKTGNLSGYAYSANCGWISLSNAFAYVRTGFIQPGADSDGDGITDAWELIYTNSLTAFTASSDTDGDGVSDLAEHGADTNPFDPNDFLHITDYLALFGGADETNVLTWTSKETRCYQLEYRTNLSVGTPWVDASAVFTPDPGETTMRLIILSGAPLAERYFRVESLKPLAP